MRFTLPLDKLGLPVRHVLPLLKARVTKYRRRWRGARGKWRYEYGQTGPRTTKIDFSHLSEDLTLPEHVSLARSFLGHHRRVLKTISAQLKTLVPAHGSFSARIKTVESALGKVVRKPELYQKADDLADGTGMRIIVGSIIEVRAVIAEVRRSHKVLSEDDYITHPQGSYRSHHLIIEGPDKLPMELQVRTQNQDRMASWQHDIYKPQTRAQFEAHTHPQVRAYETAAGNYFWDRDNGRPAKKPSCPPRVERTFGCL